MKIDSSDRRALRRARDGVTLNAAEAEILLRARGEELEELLEIASRVRDAGLSHQHRERVLTFSPKVFIPLTRLCRDRCHYCTFATTPNRVESPFLELDEVVRIARQGGDAGCLEALFTLGDRPEDRWSVAKEWLSERGYASTLDYVRACAIRVIEETGLLPHLNPGVMGFEEMSRLRPVAASMGMMLETSSTRLWATPGAAHFGSPDKDPAVRMRVITDAGRLSIPFTTGILVGIGETPEERVESIFQIRNAHKTYGHVQEVIVQNFRAKQDTAMRQAPDADFDEYLATIAVTRLILGPRMRVQAPPNLSEPTQLSRLISAGIDDWGGVSPVTIDHVNPERPWPAIEILREKTEEAGFELKARLTIHPEYVRSLARWADPRMVAHIALLADADGLANPAAKPIGRPWQELAGTLASEGRTDLGKFLDDSGRSAKTRGDFNSVYGDWSGIGEELAEIQRHRSPTLLSSFHTALDVATADPRALTDSQALTLFAAEGAELEALAKTADEVRAARVGETVTYAVNRNINFTNICYTGCRFCAFAQRKTDADAYILSDEQIAARVTEAWNLGATEVCIQGGIHPNLPGDTYFEIARTVKRAQPGMHVHAFSPMEVFSGSVKLGISYEEWLIRAKESGLDTIPGTAAEILDDEIRWILTKGKLPTSAWVEIIRTAHRLGIRTTATMMYGHVDNSSHWFKHMLLLRGIQDETNGFTEFVPLPFVHTSSPIYLAGIARPGPTVRENRVVHAMARLLLAGSIDNIQCSWVKLGMDGPDGVLALLAGGVNDIGGTLMEETISRMAGSAHGSMRSVSELEDVARKVGRPVRQRTTTYGQVSEERTNTAQKTGGILPPMPLPLLASSRPGQVPSVR